MKKIQLCALFIAPLCLLVAAAACGKDTVPMRGTQEKTVTELPEDFSEDPLNPLPQGGSMPSHENAPSGGENQNENNPNPETKQGDAEKKKPKKPHGMPPVHRPKDPLPIRPVPIPEPNPKPVV